MAIVDVGLAARLQRVQDQQKQNQGMERQGRLRQTMPTAGHSQISQGKSSDPVSNLFLFPLHETLELVSWGRETKLVPARLVTGYQDTVEA